MSVIEFFEFVWDLEGATLRYFPNKRPVGINKFKTLIEIFFKCNYFYHYLDEIIFVLCVAMVSYQKSKRFVYVRDANFIRTQDVMQFRYVSKINIIFVVHYTGEIVSYSVIRCRTQQQQTICSYLVVDFEWNQRYNLWHNAILSLRIIIHVSARRPDGTDAFKLVHPPPRSRYHSNKILAEKCRTKSTLHAFHTFDLSHNLILLKMIDGNSSILVWSLRYTWSCYWKCASIWRLTTSWQWIPIDAESDSICTYGTTVVTDLLESCYVINRTCSTQYFHHFVKDFKSRSTQILPNTRKKAMLVTNHPTVERLLFSQ